MFAFHAYILGCHWSLIDRELRQESVHNLLMFVEELNQAAARDKAQRIIAEHPNRTKLSLSWAIAMC